jgi:hypothetical protein
VEAGAHLAFGVTLKTLREMRDAGPETPKAERSRSPAFGVQDPTLTIGRRDFLFVWVESPSHTACSQFERDRP